MCGRFVSPEEALIARYVDFGRSSNPNPFARRFNVFPTDTIAFLRLPSNSDELELAAGRWGLVPHWWKDAKPPRTSFNARLEEAAGKPMWRDAWARARCLIPAEGWYEWQAVERTDPATGEIKSAKQPHFIRRKDGGLFCFAGLASYWKNPQTGEALRSCAVVTAAAAGPLAEIHDRAPVVLPESAHARWLARELTDPEEASAIAEARLPPAAFRHWKVRLLVNNAKADGPELIEPAEQDRQ
jgi:putative SOS response-associated peptidase YedK